MFETPFTAIISGGTGTGKTQWLIRFIKNANDIINVTPSHVLYCYSKINDDIFRLKNNGVELFQGVPTKEYIKSKPNGLLLILDDLISDIEPKFIDLLFTRGSHHWNVNVILVTQNLYDKNIKVARINSHYIILMKNPQGALQIKTLASQLFTSKVPYFMEAYNDAVQEKKFGYLIINMSPNANENYRLCTNIFPEENIIAYLSL
jgi:hypothetical protein